MSPIGAFVGVFGCDALVDGDRVYAADVAAGPVGAKVIAMLTHADTMHHVLLEPARAEDRLDHDAHSAYIVRSFTMRAMSAGLILDDMLITVGALRYCRILSRSRMAFLRMTAYLMADPHCVRDG